ncbi:MAG: DUF1343 domain-containing protein [Saprospiraceae bacterium]|nr:DUF1343 domain-containing protein [Saprospiraceae bacterium]
MPGAWDTEAYLPLLKSKRVGLVVNHTSTIGRVHLVDSLISRGVNIVSLFSPEHGLRGKEEAGALINDSIDAATGVKIISLYGEKKKPTPADLKGIDVLVFDIQDVGVRFYTYISTLHYLMEAAAAQGIQLIVLDRPNPNGHYIDGPLMDTVQFQSFVGMHPIPVVYGMTIGELARMINGEGWISKRCDLTVIPCKHYDHTMAYELPARPSPNLPNQRAVLLYPGICFFEGTPISLGRGTTMPFQVVGHPDYPDHTFSFTPVAMTSAKSPPMKDKLCYGVDLSKTDVDSLFQLRKMDLRVLLQFYKVMDKTTFFNASWFDKLAGNASFRKSIEAGWGEAQIRESWKTDLEKFNQRRKLYLLYPDFK